MNTNVAVGLATVGQSVMAFAMGSHLIAQASRRFGFLGDLSDDFIYGSDYMFFVTVMGFLGLILLIIGMVALEKASKAPKE